LLTTTTATGARAHTGRSGWTPGNVTRSLLGYLALAGPFYIVVSMAQAFTRAGFDPIRDEWSLLALGRLGWIQQANLVLTGVMLLVGAVGVRRAIGRRAAAGTWTPRLLAGYGLALIGAGFARADAAGGYPPGTPPGRATHITWHGNLHIVFGAVGFACLIAACFVLARHYRNRGSQRAAVASRLVGVVFTAAFAGLATGAGNAAIILGFVAAIIISFAWLTKVAVDLYRDTRIADAARCASPS
jgi:hypothetical protein